MSKDQNTIDIENKKKYLLNSSLLYDTILRQTESNCLRRFLAFRIIVNAMSFEDITKNKLFADFRQIRNTLLAHKQEDSYFNAFNASEIIVDKNIQKLLTYMTDNIIDKGNCIIFEELKCLKTKLELELISKNIIGHFYNDYYSGYRISNNYLCSQKGQFKEMTSGEVPGVFYRYNSSKELSILANYFISNLRISPQFTNTLTNFKIDYILHAVNMSDCIYKDIRNNYSIDGLFEIMDKTKIGDTSDLKKLKKKSNFEFTYNELRTIRNKLAGHMDLKNPLADNLNEVNNYDFNNAFNFVNTLDEVVKSTSNTHTVLRTRYNSFNIKFENTNIVDVIGTQNCDYFKL